MQHDAKHDDDEKPYLYSTFYSNPGFLNIIFLF